ncbi:type III secretion system cytoplasmic ring protein SctQ [Thalassospira sp. MA62]|nr:type III secretion system cytoplasmic ring protein SctQ [Thalassospira sp. MA62]
MTSMRPMSRSKISQPTRQALNSLALPRLPVDVRFADHDWRLQMRMIARHTVDGIKPDAAFTLRAKLADQQIAIMVPVSFLGDLLRTTLPAGTPISHVPESLSLALIELALAELVTRLGKNGVAFDLVGLDQNSHLPADLPHTMSLTLSDQAAAPAFAPCTLLLFATDGALPVLASLCRQVPVDETLKAPDIPTKVHLQIGETSLLMSDFRDLAAGDVIFPDVLNVPDTNSTVLLHVSKRLALRGIWQGTQITIDEVITVNMPPSDAPEIVDEDSDLIDTGPTDGSDENSDPVEMETLADLPVRLTFDLGSHEISLADLGKTGVGTVFETGRTAENMVTIRANGAAIGRGELVDLDDRTGLRITKWNVASAPSKD